MAGESSYKVKKYYVVFVGKTDKSTFKISPKAGVKRLNPGGVQLLSPDVHLGGGGLSQRVIFGPDRWWLRNRIRPTTYFWVFLI